jgi:hypothetical protein
MVVGGLYKHKLLRVNRLIANGLYLLRIVLLDRLRLVYTG